jgi:hypothetical protein
MGHDTEPKSESCPIEKTPVIGRANSIVSGKRGRKSIGCIQMQSNGSII